MTLLFFLRSPAGNTDTGASPSSEGVYWNRESAFPKRVRKKRKKKDKKKKSEEELLMMLFMHEFDGYDE